jgi:hypothetical protein
MTVFTIYKRYYYILVYLVEIEGSEVTRVGTQSSRSNARCGVERSLGQTAHGKVARGGAGSSK